VLDVLLLLPVTRRLLQGLNDQGRCWRNDRNGSLTILNRKLDRDTKTLPITRCLKLISLCMSRSYRISMIPLAISSPTFLGAVTVSWWSTTPVDDEHTETKRTNLRSQSRRSTNFSSGSPKVATSNRVSVTPKSSSLGSWSVESGMQSTSPWPRWDRILELCENEVSVRTDAKEMEAE